jgi:hypothetical protein
MKGSEAKMNVLKLMSLDQSMLILVMAIASAILLGPAGGLLGLLASVTILIACSCHD